MSGFSGVVSPGLTNADVVDNLTSTATNVPLSANQGKVLNDNKAYHFLLSASGSTSTWADMYNKLQKLSTFDTATFFSSAVASSLLTNGAVTSTMKGVVAYNGSGTYDFFAFAGLGPYAYGWRVTTLTSSTDGTVGTLYKYSPIKTITGSGTTGSNGHVQVTGISNGSIILSASVIMDSSATEQGAILIPFRDRQGRCYLKAISWSSTSYSTLNNTTINYQVAYMDP